MEHLNRIPVMNLERYAIVDASMSESVKNALVAVAKQYEKNMLSGVVLSPHGASKVFFIETIRKEGPIVDTIAHMAQQYGIYPAYVVNEDKDHAPKYSVRGKEAFTWYVVDACTMLFSKPEGGMDEFLQQLHKLLKKIYREHSTFLKLFIYEGNTWMHVVSFNSERDPKYRGLEIGVPQWREEVCNLISDMEKEYKVACKAEFKIVRYTNL